MSEQTRVRTGLVGAGYICEYHIAALRRLPGVEIVGVHDIDAGRMAETAKRFNVRPFASLQALCEAGAQVIHVLTPPHTHAKVALDALEQGCHVLVEKPLAEDVADCRRIEAVAEERGLKVCVNHSLLFDPQVRQAMAAVKRGKIGQIVSVDILRSSAYPAYRGGPLPPQYRAAGYPFRDLGVHALYLFQELLGPIEHVQADWSSLGGDPNLAFDEWRAQVRCRTGMGQFQLSWNVRPMQSQIIIQGTKGVLRVDLFLMFQAMRSSTPLPKPVERLMNAATDSIQPLIDVPRNVVGFIRKKVLPYHGLQMLVAEFYRALQEDRPVPVSTADAAPVVEWTERIARAADTDYATRISRFKLSEEAPVLVTGASGGLGSAVVERLLAEGTRVRIFVRRAPSHVPPGIEVALGDLGDPVAVDRAVRGARLVIHAGAAMKGGWDEHYGGTVVGTRNVLEACSKHGVEKLVHISSMSVIDWAGSSPAEPISEETPLEPRAEERGPYTRAKLEAEKFVVDYARQYGLATIILRPGQIFGRRIPLLTPAVARRWRGRWLILGNGKVQLPLVYIDDVVDAILMAARSSLRDAEILQLVDPEELTQNDVLRLVHGPEARVTRVPRPVVFALGKLTEILFKPLRRPSPMGVYRLRSALAQRRFQSTRAQDLLGWEPRIGVCQGIRLASKGDAQW